MCQLTNRAAKSWLRKSCMLTMPYNSYKLLSFLYGSYLLDTLEFIGGGEGRNENRKRQTLTYEEWGPLAVIRVTAKTLCCILFGQNVIKMAQNMPNFVYCVQLREISRPVVDVKFNN